MNGQNLFIQNPLLNPGYINNSLLNNVSNHAGIITGQIDYNKYVEMLIVSMIMGQIPILANTIVANIWAMLKNYYIFLLDFIRNLKLKARREKIFKIIFI